MLRQSISNKTIHHGGDISWAAQMFGYTGHNWLDLSTGINAKPYPLPPLSDKAAHLLPQEAEIQKLNHAASAYYKINTSATLAQAPGTQALIQWLPQLRGKGKTIIIGPTYMEHEICWKRSQHEVSYAKDLDMALNQSADVIILVNPNNPTGATYQPRKLNDVVKIMSAKNGLLIVDEAFCDVAPKISMARYAGQDGLIILRSFGKFFGLAGLRLGIAITNSHWAQKLNDATGPWAVSGLTIEIATKAYQNIDWITQTRTQLNTDQARMDILLETIGLSIVGGCPLFTLAEGPHAPNLFQYLGNNGIMVRHFPANDRWLRFGFPGNDNDWHRLESALKRYKNTQN